MNEERIIKVRNYVKAKLKHNINGHDFAHIERVYQNIIKLLTSFPVADKELCFVAGLTHDLIDDKVVSDVDNALLELKAFLTSLNFDKDFIKNVCFIIENMSYRKQKKDIFLHLIEGQIVQDADRLDALGAIGIARTFIYGGSKGSAIYLEGDESNATIIGHFHAKLYKLLDVLNTESARQIAKKRISFMRQFEAQIIQEIQGEI